MEITGLTTGSYILKSELAAVQILIRLYLNVMIRLDDFVHNFNFNEMQYWDKMVKKKVHLEIINVNGMFI